MRIAQIAPLTEAIPPKFYGGTERVISWLTDELVALGHEITVLGWKLSIIETALATLIHQRRLTPSCGGQAPTAERTLGPARTIAESLTPKPGIREHNRHLCDIHRCPLYGRFGR